MFVNLRDRNMIHKLIWFGQDIPIHVPLVPYSIVGFMMSTED